MLTGQSKTDYQRAYMRARRSNAITETVRPIKVVAVRPVIPAKIPINPHSVLGLPYSESEWAYIQSKGR